MAERQVRDSELWDYKFKVITLGDSAVGKSSLIMRYCDALLPRTMTTTIGIDFKHKDIRLAGQRVRLQIWDTAGQERFDDITRAYTRGAVGVLFVYDITQPRSFERVRRWMSELRASDDVLTRNSVQVLVGNKCDLAGQRRISTEQGEAFARQHGLKFFETSATTNEQVSECFLTVANDVLRNEQARSTAMEGIALEGGSGDWRERFLGCLRALLAMDRQSHA